MYLISRIGRTILRSSSSSPSSAFAYSSLTPSRRYSLIIHSPIVHRRSFHSSHARNMNVTKDNFLEVAKELAVLIPTSSFIGIDEEMTGIHLPGVFVERMCDSTDERYAKMRDVAQHYKIIQIGLCLFHEIPRTAEEQDGEEHVVKYTARPYNFYLFPEDGMINMEAKAIMFNRSHGMDFNKWIYSGVPYVTDAVEVAMREKTYPGDAWILERKRERKARGLPAEPEPEQVQEAVAMDDATTADASATLAAEVAAVVAPVAKKEKKPVVLTSPADIAVTDEIKASILSFLATRSDEVHELVLPEINSFLRLFMHQWFATTTSADLTLASASSSSSEADASSSSSSSVRPIDRANVFLETRSIAGQKWCSSFVVSHYTPLEKVALAELAAEQKRKEFDSSLGFKLVWNTLLAARVPIVVHNGFFDLLFMFSHFSSQTLPDNLDQFKTCLSRAFPAGVYDTKYLSNSRQFAYPWEHLAGQAHEAANNEAATACVDESSSSSSSSSDSADESASAALSSRRLDAFRELALSASAMTTNRFRQTHLERLYHVLQQETVVRESAAAAAAAASVKEVEDVVMDSATIADASSSSSAPVPAVAPARAKFAAVASLPPPLAGVNIVLADGFSKYALVGKEGGDPSAAHEAGYDAYMTACIFAHFASEAPLNEIQALLRGNVKTNEARSTVSPSTSASSSSSISSIRASPWLNRVPLFRHLMALNLNISASGVPMVDSLIDTNSTVYLVRGFALETSTADIAAVFEEKYVSKVRPREVEEGKDGGEGKKQKTDMEDVATSASTATVAAATTSTVDPISSPSLALSSSPILTSPPKIIWCDDTALFISVILADTPKMDAFIAKYVNTQDGNAEIFWTKGMTIEKFATTTK